MEDKNASDNIATHLNYAKGLWDDEGVETPGENIEDFITNYYAPQQAARSERSSGLTKEGEVDIDPVKGPSELATSQVDKYKTYF